MDIFISYAHEDRWACEELLSHLGWLRHSKQIKTFEDRQIAAGARWRDTIAEEMGKARVVVFLVSRHFLNSEFCTLMEMQGTLESDATPMPVLLGDCHYSNLPLAERQFLPRHANANLVAIEDWGNSPKHRNAAWKQVATAIDEASQPPPAGLGEAPRQPATHNLPPRNRQFVGREAELASLDRRLERTRNAVLTEPVAFTGLGGIGKTELARHYAWSRITDFNLIHWMAAERPGSLQRDFLKLAAFFNIPELEPNVQIAAICQTLERTTGWLLVFDNAEDPKLLAHYLPQTGSGQILITSRNRNWGRTAQIEELDLLSPEDARALLRQGSPEDNDHALDVLATDLGHLALALSQASALMRENAWNAGQYTAHLKAREAEALDFLPEDSDYPKGLIQTWDASLDAARNRCAHAPLLLEHIAFLAPDAIPRDLFPSAQLPPPLDDQETCTRALAALACTSLVTLTPEIVALHRVVQAVIRIRLTQSDKFNQRLRTVFNWIVDVTNKSNDTQSERHNPEIIASHIKSVRDISRNTCAEVDILFCNLFRTYTKELVNIICRGSDNAEFPHSQLIMWMLVSDFDHLMNALSIEMDKRYKNLNDTSLSEYYNTLSQFAEIYQ